MGECAVGVRCAETRWWKRRESWTQRRSQEDGKEKTGDGSVDFRLGRRGHKRTSQIVGKRGIEHRAATSRMV